MSIEASNKFLEFGVFQLAGEPAGYPSERGGVLVLNKAGDGMVMRAGPQCDASLLSGAGGDNTSPGIGRLSNAQLLAIFVRLPRADQAAISLTSKRFRRLIRDGAFLRARNRCPLTGISCLERKIFCHYGAYGCVVVCNGDMYKLSFLDDESEGRNSGLVSKYSPDLDRWIPATPFSYPEDVTCKIRDNQLEQYIHEDEWYDEYPLDREPPCQSIVVACCGKIYLIGGTRVFTPWDDLTGGLPMCHRYDPKTLEWEQIPSLPSDGAYRVAESEAWLARRGVTVRRYCYGMGAAVVGEKIFLFGGQCDGNEATDRVLALDTVSLEWSYRTPMPGPRNHPDCHAKGDQIYVFGGCFEVGEEFETYPTYTTWRYDANLDQWTELRTAPGHVDSMSMIENGDYYSDVLPRRVLAYYEYTSHRYEYDRVTKNTIRVPHVYYETTWTPDLKERCSYHIPTDTWVHGAPGLKISAKPSPSHYGCVYVDLP